MKANSHHPRVNNILTEQSMREQSPIAKKIWLSIHPRNFGSRMTMHQFNIIVRLSTPQGNQCEISHFQASVGACNLVLHIHVVVK